jgi:aspartate/methionine/tyrosine aminotransferase
MKFEDFTLERFQSIWENRVAWNVAESGVHPLRVEEIAETAEDRASVLGLHMLYPQTNGSPELRAHIAAMYPGATLDHVQVTNGGSEANCITLMHLVERGDEVVMMVPNYMQVRGLARAFGTMVKPWPLVEERSPRPRWRPDLATLESLVTSKTRVILLCNPNNPTGATLTADELDAIARIASRAGAWILSDEIYRGAELEGDDPATSLSGSLSQSMAETPTMWGRYERVIVTSGLSKAYALPGLRIGWAVGPPAAIEALWGIHDYTSIAPGAVNDRLASIALRPDRRQLLLARTRGIIRTNYPIVKRWIERRSPWLIHVPPQAGAIVFARYSYPIGSTELVTRLREEKGVLVVPGDHFEMDGHLRIGFGSDPKHLASSLELIGELLDTLVSAPAPPSMIDAR